MDGSMGEQARSNDATQVVERASPQTMIWFGRFSGYGGLADAAYGYIEACNAAGIPVVMVDTISTKVLGPRPAHIREQYINNRLVLSSLRGGERFITVFHDSPDLARKIAFEGAVRNIGFIVSETQDFPRQWALRLMDCHEVWTASDFNVENISKLIPPFMVKKVPHVIPALLGNFEPRKTDRQSIVFGTLASRRDRRRVGQLVRVFQQARAKNTIPEASRLVIKTSNREEVSQTCQDANLDNLSEYDLFENVEFVDTYFSRQDVWEWMNTIDVMVNTEWGKGWDLPGFYAMALGNICVSTKFGGNTEFMTETNSILMDFYTDFPDPADAVNVELYCAHKAGFVSDTTMEEALEKASKKATGRKSVRTRNSILKGFSAERVGQKIASLTSDYEVYDFYDSKAPKLSISQFRPVKASNDQSRGELAEAEASNQHLLAQIVDLTEKYDHQKEEGERRHGIIVQLRQQVADVTEKYEHQKSEGLRRHNIILELREEVAALTNKLEKESQKVQSRDKEVSELRLALAEEQKRVAFHLDERQEFIRQREYMRTFRYLSKTAPSRALEVIGLKKNSPSE